MECSECGRSGCEFSKTQMRMAASTRRCIDCINAECEDAATESHAHSCCTDCKAWLPSFAFSRTQLRLASYSRRCTACIEAEWSEPTTDTDDSCSHGQCWTSRCSNCQKSVPLSAYSKTQLKRPSYARQCKTCVGSWY